MVVRTVPLVERPIELTVRRSTPTDRSALVALRADAEFRRLSGTENADAVSEHHLVHLLLEFVADRPDFVLLLAFDADEVIGTVIVHPVGVLPEFTYDSERSTVGITAPVMRALPARAELDDFYVVEHRRGQGVGTALVRFAIETANELGYSEVTMTSTSPAALHAARAGGLKIDV